MPPSSPPLFASRGTTDEIESGSLFTPKFGADGLLPAIVTDRSSGEVLMLAWMNAEALALTVDTGLAHFWTRSRGRIWKKGEDSAYRLRSGRPCVAGGSGRRRGRTPYRAPVLLLSGPAARTVGRLPRRDRFGADRLGCRR